MIATERTSGDQTGERVETVEIELPGIGEPEALVSRRRVVAPPGPGQVLVRMEATGVSYAEQQMRLGKYYDQPPFPFVPGYDLVGVVERLGPGATAGLREGQRVAAVTKTGAWAERIVLDAGDVVPVPAGIDAVVAETAIVNGITAWRMLHRIARPPAGSRVVVLGAAGGVGSVLVQLARAAGLRRHRRRQHAAAGGDRRARRHARRLPRRGRPLPRRADRSRGRGRRLRPCRR